MKLKFTSVREPRAIMHTHGNTFLKIKQFEEGTAYKRSQERTIEI